MATVALTELTVNNVSAGEVIPLSRLFQYTPYAAGSGNSDGTYTGSYVSIPPSSLYTISGETGYLDVIGPDGGEDVEVGSLLQGSAGTITPIAQGYVTLSPSYVGRSFQFHDSDLSLIAGTPNNSRITLSIVKGYEPSTLEYAELSNSVYSDGSPLPVGWQKLGTGVSGAYGFAAQAYVNGTQIVIAFRGTVTKLIDDTYSSVKNIVDDSSFVTGQPTASFKTNVLQAADYLSDISIDNPDSYIKLTGHSLGGAIAQLLGAYGERETVTFNAPGPADFVPALKSQLSILDNLSSNVSEDFAVGNKGSSASGEEDVTNYRLAGDVVSTVGVQEGIVETLSNPSDPTTEWIDALTQHSIDTVTQQISQLASGSPYVQETSGLRYPDITVDLVTATAVVSAVASVFRFAASALSFNPIDPDGGANYQLTGSADSPTIAAVILPALDAVSQWQVSFLSGSTWSMNVGIAPGQTYTLPEPSTGIRFSALDSSGNIVTLIDSLVFDISLSSAGSFTGTFQHDAAPVDPSGSATFMDGGINGLTLTGNDVGGNLLLVSGNGSTVNAGGGSSLVFASGASATVNGGSGTLTFVGGYGTYLAGGGSGLDILYSGNGTNVLVGSSGANSILVAGAGNTSLQGGLGNSALMFGGSGSNTFTGSGGGSDTLVGGTGGNTFNLTGNDVAFGGTSGGDVFYAGTGSSLIVEGLGATHVTLDGGFLTAFAGSGPDDYVVTKGEGGIADIIGFKSDDHLTLTGGFADAGTILAGATTGAFGTTLSLGDGTQINLFGTTLNSSQISSA